MAPLVTVVIEKMLNRNTLTHSVSHKECVMVRCCAGRAVTETLRESSGSMPKVIKGEEGNGKL